MANDQQAAFFECVEAVRAEYDAEVFVFSGAINAANYGGLVTQVAKPRSNKNALLILTTFGGQANAAYKIARLLQRSFDKFILYTPRSCYSAGTLVALGAHEIIMDQFSELGPLDVQLLKKNELGDQKSGLLSASTFDSLSIESFDFFEHFMFHIIARSGGLISFNVASEVAAKITGQVMAPVFAQVNPDIVGSDYRDLRVAVEYGNRLINLSKNAELSAVDQLVNGYPAHDFIIDNEEAKTLFKRVNQPSESLYRLIGKLAGISFGPASPPVVIKLESPPPKDETPPEPPSGKPRPTDKPDAQSSAKGAKRPVADRGRGNRKRDRPGS